MAGHDSLRELGSGIQGEYMDLLYGDPATRMTSDLLSRATISAAVTIQIMYTCARTPRWRGFKAGPALPSTGLGTPPNGKCCTRRKTRATLFEAFSVAPLLDDRQRLYLGQQARTTSGQPPPRTFQSFVQYLTTVVKHFRDVEGVHFESLEPFNEPDLKWGAGGRQEGYSASPSTRNT